MKNIHFKKAMLLANKIPNEGKTKVEWKKRATAARKWLAEVKLMLCA